MTAPVEPFRESLRTTLVRTVGIAVVVGAVLARLRGGLAAWPAASLVVLWPSFGGHWLDVFFLNWLRPRISPDRVALAAARLGVWFVGGIVLGLGMAVTATTLARYPAARLPTWWMAGSGFVAIELLAQAVLSLRGRPSFYNGRG
ncbi:MAG TPA: hypothetical protein VF483_03435 [Gemmatimonadaceae bacterium]